MLTDPLTLFDRTISNLHLIAELLADEFDERIHSNRTEHGRLCEETHNQILMLMPKLKAARMAQLPPEMRGQRPTCPDCD